MVKRLSGYLYLRNKDSYATDENIIFVWFYDVLIKFLLEMSY